MSRKKILFFAEGATLAHVARPIVLAQSLDPSEFDVVFYRPAAYQRFTSHLRDITRDLKCQSAAEFIHRLERGRPLYDLATLRKYVNDELQIIKHEQPDIIAGDFRITLAISARLNQIPYLSICDAYWYHEIPLIPQPPVFSFTRYIPLPIFRRAFTLVTPIAFKLHALAMEKLRQEYGLPSLNYDLRRIYTEADLRLFANFRQLYPDLAENNQARFIGPVTWSPAQSTSLNLEENNSPLAYVTMGSSGDPTILSAAISALESKKFRVIVATAGKPVTIQSALPTTQIMDFVSGTDVCQKASLVICNGGSPTTNQALSSGVPVIGIASNMDQFLNMKRIVDYGAGLLLRADRASEKSVGKAISVISNNQNIRLQAKTLAIDNPETECTERFKQSLRSI